MYKFILDALGLDKTTKSTNSNTKLLDEKSSKEMVQYIKFGWNRHSVVNSNTIK